MPNLAYRFHYRQHRNMTTNLSSKLLLLLLCPVGCSVKQNDSTRLINTSHDRKKKNCIKLTQKTKSVVQSNDQMILPDCDFLHGNTKKKKKA